MMAKILLIETATKVCSVGISSGGTLLAIQEVHDENYSHSEKLHMLIQKLMDENGMKFSDLDAVCVSKGPGSFTGLRIGVSTAKGYCFSMEIPLISIDTTKAMAAQFYQSNLKEKGLFAPMIDARRMEVYNAIYRSDLSLVKELSADILEPATYTEFEVPIVFAGDGMPKWKEICQHPQAEFIELYPSVKGMSELAFEKFQKQIFENVAYFEPFYLKDFVAGKKIT